MVLGIDAPGFDDLPVERRIFAYYLYRAAIAGDRIMYLQNHRHAAAIKDLLETILAHSDGLRETLRESVHDYLKYIWIHHGNYHHHSHTKFVPNSLSFDELKAAADHASSAGADFGEPVNELLERVRRTIFDADYEPVQSNHSPGEDIVATSAVNFWDRGVTAADIDRVDEKYRTKLNVRFAWRNGKIVPEVFKIGGLYSEELETVSHFLELALPYAETKEQRRSIELLLAYYRSGDEEDFRRHSVEWLKSDATVDYLNGFIEQYIDPRATIGSFEANVSFAADVDLVRHFSENAIYFERKMPWPDKYKRTNIDPPVAKVVNVLVETGDGGPVSPAAYNLPNYNDLRRDHGSKNVMLLNIENAASRSLLEQIAGEFYLPQYRDNVVRYSRSVVRPLKVYMHEIIGHGSGQPDTSLDADPRTMLGRLYSPLEECRADLVALFHMSDPKLVEIGAVPADEQEAIVETAYITFVQGWMTRLDRIVGLKVREAHDKGHHLILMYLLEGGDDGKDFGLRVVRQDGDFFVDVTDPRKFHDGLEELLVRLQVLKSTGDMKGAEALFDRYATDVDPVWFDNVSKRLKRLGVPKQSAFVFPHLKPRLKDGKLVNVDIAFDEDLTAQQLRFSRLHNVKRISADD